MDLKRLNGKLAYQMNTESSLGGIEALHKDKYFDALVEQNGEQFPKILVKGYCLAKAYYHYLELYDLHSTDGVSTSLPGNYFNSPEMGVFNKAVAEYNLDVDYMGRIASLMHYQSVKYGKVYEQFPESLFSEKNLAKRMVRKFQYKFLGDPILSVCNKIVSHDYSDDFFVEITKSHKWGYLKMFKDNFTLSEPMFFYMYGKLPNGYEKNDRQRVEKLSLPADSKEILEISVRYYGIPRPTEYPVFFDTDLAEITDGFNFDNYYSIIGSLKTNPNYTMEEMEYMPEASRLAQDLIKIKWLREDEHRG